MSPEQNNQGEIYELPAGNTEYPGMEERKLKQLDNDEFLTKFRRKARDLKCEITSGNWKEGRNSEPLMSKKAMNFLEAGLHFYMDKNTLLSKLPKGVIQNIAENEGQTTYELLAEQGLQECGLDSFTQLRWLITKYTIAIYVSLMRAKKGFTAKNQRSMYQIRERISNLNDKKKEGSFFSIGG